MGNPYAPPSGNTPRPPTPAPRPPEPLPHPVPGAPRPGAPRPGGPEPVGRSLPRPDPEAARVASRHIMHFGLLLLAGMVTSSLPLPWQVASLAFVGAALVVGVRALLAVWRAGLRGVLVPMLAIGLAFTALMSMLLVALLALWPVQLANQQCLQSALTISANEKCRLDFQHAVDQRYLDLSRTRTGA